MKWSIKSTFYSLFIFFSSLFPFLFLSSFLPFLSPLSLPPFHVCSLTWVNVLEVFGYHLQECEFWEHWSHNVTCHRNYNFGLVERKRMSSLPSRTMSSLRPGVCCGCLSHGKCSWDISQSNMDNKHITGYVILWTNLMFLSYTTINAIRSPLPGPAAENST